MMNNKYPLEWLDSLILQHFNPDKTDLSKFTENDLSLILKNAEIESTRIQVRVKNEIFALKRKRQIRLLVRKYHSTLIFLMDNMVETCKISSVQVPMLSNVADGIVRCLDELLSFLENRYAAYLSLDEKVPISYLIVSKKEMHLKLKKIKVAELKCENANVQEVLTLVYNELNNVLLMQNRNRITFRQVLYLRKIIKELEDLECSNIGSDFFSVLDYKLISLNFNSRSYINLLLKRLGEKVLSAEVVTLKLSLLSFYYKEFRQISSNNNLFFNADVQPISTVLENWFKNEIEYQDKLLQLSTDVREANSDGKHENKLECDLSADQIGIILRAADEARVVKSRSMSLVFQRIVPHLSTAVKKELSYQSVRSKSYNAEESDKNIAILTLEKMIRKIQSY